MSTPRPVDAQTPLGHSDIKCVRLISPNTRFCTLGISSCHIELDTVDPNHHYWNGPRVLIAPPIHWHCKHHLCYHYFIPGRCSMFNEHAFRCADTFWIVFVCINFFLFCSLYKWKQNRSVYHPITHLILTKSPVIVQNSEYDRSWQKNLCEVNPPTPTFVLHLSCRLEEERLRKYTVSPCMQYGHGEVCDCQWTWLFLRSAWTAIDTLGLLSCDWIQWMRCRILEVDHGVYCQEEPCQYCCSEWFLVRWSPGWGQWSAPAGWTSGEFSSRICY